MDNRPIGVFDSGLGGLTVVREIMNLLPHEHIIYFGDTGRAPYGGHSTDTIIKYARQNIHFLHGFNIKAIAVACGTVSTTVIDTLAEENNIPILGVVEGAALRAAQITRNHKIAILATQAAIRSGRYEDKISQTLPDAQFVSIPCPLLVPLIENGRFLPGDSVIETVTAEYLAPAMDFGADVIVLGCTHYPLLEDIINARTAKSAALVNPGAEFAARLKLYLHDNDLFADPQSPGSLNCFVSDRTDDFSRYASIFLRRDITLVSKINIEDY